MQMRCVHPGHACPAALALLTGAALTAAALAAHVELRVPDAAIYVDDPFQVSVVVTDHERCEPPAAPALPDAAIVAAGAFTEQYTELGPQGATARRTQRYAFQVTARRAGPLTIPAIPVVVDGRTLRTDPVTVDVRVAPAAPGPEQLWVRISSPRPRAYVGQRLTLTLEIGVRAAEVYGHRLTGRDMYMFINRTTQLGPFPAPERVREQPTRTPDGATTTYYVYESTLDYVPARPGAQSFDDILVLYDYPVRFARDVFGELRATDTRRLSARPEPLALEVLPLPANPPEGFNGAVGTFDLTVTAQPTDVRVGDPIELTLEVRGDGPLDTLAAPRLAALPALTADFRVVEDAPAGIVEGSRKRFTAVIRARRADVARIPAIEFPYFDPDRGVYAVTRSAPLPLRVSATDQLDTTAIEGLDPRAATGTPRRGDDLLDNETRPERLLARPRRVGAGHVAAALLAPPAAYGVLWGFLAFQQARRADPARRRRGQAGRVARRRISAAQHEPATAQAAAVSAALAGYVADRLDLPPARLNGAALLTTLRERSVSPDTLARCAALLERCEQVSFGGQATEGAAALADEARACLARLEGERL